MMPLVRIDLARGKPPGYRHAIADVIYTAMTGVLNVPNDDRFMVITEHDQADLVISPEYLGIGHTAPTIRPSPITGAMASSTSVISSSVAPTASAWLLLHSRQTSIVGTRRRPRHHPDMGMYMG
jgi:hypothetical protein